MKVYGGNPKIQQADDPATDRWIVVNDGDGGRLLVQ